MRLPPSGPLYPAPWPAILGKGGGEAPGELGGRGAGPLPHSRAGIQTQPGCGWTARRGRRARRWAAYSPDGAAGSGRPRGETRASTALGRAGGLTGERGETSPRCLCRRCCHRAINTGSAHTRRRLRRVPSAESAAGGWAAGAQGQRLRAGDCRGSSCAAASASGGMASRHPRPPAPSPPACAAGRPQPRAARPAAEPACPGRPASAEPAGAGGGRPRNAAGLRGWGGSLQPRVSAAVPSSWGNRRLLKPGWKVLRELQTF